MKSFSTSAGDSGSPQSEIKREHLRWARWAALLILLFFLSSTLILAYLGYPVTPGLFSLNLILLVAIWLCLRLMPNPHVPARMFLAVLIGICCLQTARQHEDGFFFFWLFPVPLVLGFVLGRAEGRVWSVVTWLTMTGILFLNPLGSAYPPGLGLRFSIAFGASVLLTYEVEAARSHYAARLHQKRADLRHSLADIELLQGCLPICARCKAVRDDQGLWSSIERYLDSRSMAQVAEALCPDCRQSSNSTGLEPIFEAAAEPGEDSASVDRPNRHLGVTLTAPRRRRYVAICLGLTIACGLLFGTTHLIAGRTVEGAVSLGLAAVFSILLPLVPRCTRLRPITYVWALALVAFYTSNLALGTSGGHSYFWYLTMPPIFYAIFGAEEGSFWNGLLIVSASAVFVSPGAHPYPVGLSVRFISVLILVTAISYSWETSRRGLQRRLKAETLQVQAAVDHAATLRGILPICSQCKRVREDQGFWSQVEDYLARHAGTQTSHGLCPDCTRREMGLIESYPAPPGDD